MRKVATATETPCIDLQARSAELLKSIGEQKGTELYLVYPAGGGPPEVLPQLLTEGMVLRALGG